MKKVKAKKQARPKKNAKTVSAEKWTPGRTLDSVNAIPLSNIDLTEVFGLLGISNDQSKSELMDKLQSISRRYLEQIRDMQKPPARWYRQRVGRIQKHAQATLKCLREPGGTALTQLKIETQRFMGLPLLGKTEPSSIEKVIADFVNVCEHCSYASQRGARADIAITEAAAALANVWSTCTSKPFPKSFRTGDNRKDQDGSLAKNQKRNDEFVADGPRFVHLVLRRIDPAVKPSAVATALRKPVT